jgi:hypothetical protein
LHTLPPFQVAYRCVALDLGDLVHQVRCIAHGRRFAYSVGSE